MSHLKRDLENDWATAWRKHHIQFLDFFQHLTPVKYQNDVNKLSVYLAKKFYPNMGRCDTPYYRNEMTTLFGNASARTDYNVLHVSELKSSRDVVLTNNLNELDSIDSHSDYIEKVILRMPMLETLNKKLQEGKGNNSFCTLWNGVVISRFLYNLIWWRSFHFKRRNMSNYTSL